MPRKRPPAAISRAKPAADAGAAGRETASLPTLPLLVFPLVALVFIVLYFSNAPEQFLAQRQQTLAFLLAPDELFLIWCGGKLSYFSLFDRWPIALLAAIILAAAWLAGRLALLAIGVMGQLTRLERIVFSLGVGLNLLSIYVLAVGLAGGLHQRWLFIGPIILLLAGSKLAPGTRLQVGEPIPEPLAAPRDQVWSRLRELDDRRWLWWLAL